MKLMTIMMAETCFQTSEDFEHDFCCHLVFRCKKSVILFLKKYVSSYYFVFILGHEVQNKNDKLKDEAPKEKIAVC